MDTELIDRRQFVGGAGMLTGTLMAGSALALLAPARAWAVDLVVLDTAEGTALLMATRTIAPHDTLAEAAYALVVKAIDAECARDAATLAMLRTGLAQLGTGFATATEAVCVAALTAVENTAFFRFLRHQTLSNLYSSAIAYAHFGYEGESFSKGGYLRRGFNDLRWLPDVPLADSGPVFAGTVR
jgi:hypothetical protein